MTPAALTARVKGLKAAVGLPLFTRTPGGLKLNAAGEAALAHIEGIERSVRDMLEAREDLRELLKLVDRDDVISFAGGIPDPALFPVEAARAAYADALGHARALQYGVSEGHAPLRAWIAREMAREGVAADPDSILVTAGSQQGLDFLGKALFSPGDTILCEHPTLSGRASGELGL